MGIMTPRRAGQSRGGGRSHWARTLPLAISVIWASAGAGAPGLAAEATSKTSKTGKPSSLEPIHEAQRRFNLGVTLYQEEDLRGALAEFKGAYKVDPVYRVLYNLGLVSRELNDWAGAQGYYRKYLAEGEERVPAERRVQVEREILELAQRVGRLEIEVRDGPAEVQVDDQIIDAAKLDEPVLVNPGKRRVRVTFPGKAPQLRSVEIASGERIELVFEGSAATAAKTASARASERAEKPPEEKVAEDPPNWPGGNSRSKSKSGKSRSGAAVYTWVGTGVLAAAAGVTGYFAYRASGRLVNDRAMFPVNGTELANDRSTVQMLSTTADGLLAGAVLGALISSYLTWWFEDGGKGRDVEGGHAAQPPVAGPKTVALGMAPGGLGLSYAGSF